MSVLAGVELEAPGGAGLAAGLGKGTLPGSLQSKTSGSPAAASANSSAASLPNFPSFRSSWLTQFESLASGPSVPGDGQTASTIASAANQASQTMRASEFLSRASASSSATDKPAAQSPLRLSGTLEKGSEAAMNSIPQPQSAAQAQSPATPQSALLQEPASDLQAARRPDAKGPSGASSSDSTAAHAARRAKQKSTSFGQVPAPAPDSASNGLAPVLASQSPVELSQNTFPFRPATDPSTASPSASDAVSNRLAHAGGSSQQPPSSAAAAVATSPNRVASLVDDRIATQAGRSASTGADSPRASADSPAQSREIPSPPSSSAGELLQTPIAGGSSKEAGTETGTGPGTGPDVAKSLQLPSSGADSSAAPATHGLDAGSVNLSPNPAITTGSASQAPLPPSSAGSAASNLLFDPPAALSQTSVPLPSAAPPVRRPVRVSADAGAGNSSHASVLSSAESRTAFAETATPSQSSASGGQASSVSPAQLPAFQSNTASADRHPAQQNQAQPGFSQPGSRSATLPAHAPHGVEAGSSPASASKAEIRSGEASSSTSAGSSAQAASRNAYATEAHHKPGPGSQALPTQTSGDPSSLARNPDLPSVQQSRGEARTGNSTASAPAAAGETFATIDSAAESAPSWTHLSPHRAEAGIQDPALGWIGVRADGSAGQVRATLVPGSADAAQALGGHMAGLNTYLADAHVSIQSLHIAAPEARQADPGSGRDQGQSMGQGSNQNSSQNPDQGTNQNPSQGSAPGSSRDFVSGVPSTAASAQARAQVSPESLDPPAGLREFSGRHISVIA